MATKTYIHPFTYGKESPLAVDFYTYAIRQRMPTWRVCPDPKPPFILDGQDNWNCMKCEGQKVFSLPVNSADEFEFQFQFGDTVNADVMDPVFGWLDTATPESGYYMAARILDCECNGVPDMVYIDQFASDYGVAYDTVSGSLQWLKLDVGLLPSDLCCFILQVEQYVLDAALGIPVLDKVITAGPFYRSDLSNCGPCDDATVLISAKWKKIDCWGRRYDVPFGDSDTLFTDSVRLVGSIEYLGSENESVFDGEIEVKTKKREKYRLDLAGIPPLIAQWIGTLIAANDLLVIGDYTINRKNGDTVGSVNRSIQDVQMFYTAIEFSQVCEVNNFGCN